MSSERVQFGQTDRAGRVFGLSWASLFGLGVAAGILLSSVVAAGLTGFGTALVVAGPLGLSTVLRVEGRPVIEWVPIGATWWWRKASAQHRYLAGPRVSELGELVLPGRVARLRLAAGPDDVAIVEDPAASTLAVCCRVGHLPFLLADQATQTRRVESWGTLLAQLGSAPGLVRLQVLERSVPDSADAWLAHFDAYGKHGTQAGTEYSRLVTHAGPAAERHEAYLCFVFSRRQLERDIRRSGGGRVGLAAVVAQRLVWAEAALAAAECGSLLWLRPRQLAGVIHATYDPAWSLGASHNGAEPDHETDPALAGPEACEESWEALRADSGSHVTYRVAEWPRLAVGPDLLASVLLSTGVRRSFSLHIEPVSLAKAEREIRAAKAEHAASVEAKARLGQVRSQREDARLADVLRREADLVAGHVELRYAALLSVSAGDPSELEGACVAVEQAGQRAHLELRRLYGQQAQGLAAASLPLGVSVLQGSRTAERPRAPRMAR